MLCETCNISEVRSVRNSARDIAEFSIPIHALDLPSCTFRNDSIMHKMNDERRTHCNECFIRRERSSLNVWCSTSRQSDIKWRSFMTGLKDLHQFGWPTDLLHSLSPSRLTAFGDSRRLCSDFSASHSAFRGRIDKTCITETLCGPLQLKKEWRCIGYCWNFILSYLQLLTLPNANANLIFDDYSILNRRYTTAPTPGMTTTQRLSAIPHDWKLTKHASVLFKTT